MEVFEEENTQTPLAKCRTNNIGMGGLMMQHQGLAITEGDSVSVVLKATCRTGLKVFPAVAKVVWVSSDAIGLQFSSLDETEQQNFRRFLFESKVSAHSGERRRSRDGSSEKAAAAQ